MVYRDSDELLNFYTRTNIIDYNYEPYYDRNKTSYFWCVASTEGDIKRTHSGQPRNIIDTLVNIVGLPILTLSESEINSVLEKILDDNDFNKMFLQEQLPLTLVEGWGCYKINWDTGLRDTPILLYYRADAVDFIYKGNQLIAIIFKDYYWDEEGRKYLLTETRRLEKRKGAVLPDLVVEKELFELGSDQSLTPKALKDLKQLSDVEPAIRISNYSGFLAVPCSIYKDTQLENQGRSIFTGKIDMFDDLDQCLSQAANTVRRSTVREYFNSNYLERDPDTGMPQMPNAFDRKYVVFNGGKTADGSTAGQEAIVTTQPALNIVQYSQEAQNLLIEIISGIMSPATLGIDIAKKDNAEAQREKEKVTIFTRNTIIAEESKILRTLCRELLCAKQLMTQEKITARDYTITVKFDEFADASWEAKINSLLEAWNADVITPELFVDMLYKDSLSKKDKQRELDYIKDRMAQAESGPGMPGVPGGLPEEQGPMGVLGAQNEYNEMMADPAGAAEAMLAGTMPQ